MLEKKITIGYISPYRPDDRKASSGTMYTIIKALESIGADVLWIPISGDCIWKKLNRYKHYIERKTKFNIPLSFEKQYARFVCSTIDNKLIDKCDILFNAFQSHALYGINTNKPIIYLSDATYKLMIDYYLFNVGKREQRYRNEIEQNALNVADAIVLSSQWAADSAVNDYCQPKEKIHILEFGANIDEKDIIPHEFKFYGHLDLLFLGVDWNRKGGDIAVKATEWLNNNGVPSTLHIVGIKNLNEDIKKISYIDYVGFLNKNDEAQYNKLCEIIKKCHCMLLPTLAECSAIAFCESSANGLPIFSHLTGGVSNYVVDGENGYLLPLGSKGEDFGKKIKYCLESGELEKMSVTAVDLYRKKLNWNTWSEKMEKILKSLIDK